MMQYDDGFLNALDRAVLAIGQVIRRTQQLRDASSEDLSELKQLVANARAMIAQQKNPQTAICA